MNSIVKIFLGLILLASIVSAASVEIDSSNSIPAGTLWTAGINYNLSSEEELKVFLDNELTITVFEHNGKVFVDETLNSSKLLNYSTTKGELTLSIAGMKEGKYKFESKVYSGEELIDSDSKEIEFYNWQDRINYLENINQTQSNLIKTLQSDLNAKSLEIEKLKINNQLTIESLRQINSNITTLQESDVDKNNSLTQINSDLNKLLKDKELETSITGLFGFASNPFSIVALIGILALIAIGIVLYQNNKKKDALYQ